MYSIAATGHVAVVFNPTKDNLPAVREAAAKLEKAHGCQETRWYETAAEDSGAGAAEQAVADGASAVAAVGGDGTVRGVAEVLRGTDVPLVIVPSGTGNLLARNIGVPLSDPEVQLAPAFAGLRTPIDTGVVTITRADGEDVETVFLVLTGMGLDARMIAETNDDLKSNIGWLAYLDSGLRALRSNQVLTADLTADDLSRPGVRALSVMVGNCGALQGGIQLIPDAKIDDGKLDVAVLKAPRGKRNLYTLRALHKITIENSVLGRTAFSRKLQQRFGDRQSVAYRQVSEFSAKLQNPAPIQVDGEDFGEAVAMHTSIEKSSLVLATDPSWHTGDSVFSADITA